MIQLQEAIKHHITPITIQVPIEGDDDEDRSGKIELSEFMLISRVRNAIQEYVYSKQIFEWLKDSCQYVQ